MPPPTPPPTPPPQVLKQFFGLRLSYYEKRKLHLSELLTGEWTKLDNKTRFVLAVISGELKISSPRGGV